MRHVVIVTGASSGLGSCFAREADRQRDRVSHPPDEIWLLARRRERLEALARELVTPARVMPADLLDDGVWPMLYEALEETPTVVTALVNAAGFGKVGDFADISPDAHRDMMRLNMEVPTLLNQLVLPYLQAGSAIINVASVAGFLPQTHFNVYAATKAYVIRHSRALHDELKDKGITVTAVCPGPMETEFFDVASSPETKDEVSAIKRIGIEEPETVAAKAWSAAMAGRPLAVTRWSGKLIHIISRLIPHRFVLWVERHLGL